MLPTTHKKTELTFGVEYVKLFRDETIMALIFQYPIPLMEELIKIGNYELILFDVRNTVGWGNGCISFRNF